METTFRRATQSDLPRMMEILAQGSAALKAAGIPQWQGGYPSKELIASDIEGGSAYILLQDGQIIGTSALCYGEEPDYAKIYEGGWHTTSPYAAIHRIAMDAAAKGSGAAGLFMQNLLETAARDRVQGVRVDTHRLNKRMQRFLQKHGFVYCGIIYLTSDGAERFAFDRCF